MELKKDTHGNAYIDVAAGKGNVRITYVKNAGLARITGGGLQGAIECKTEHIPTLIEALASIYTASLQ